MKKILVLNSGSSTLKFMLYEADGGKFRVLAKGLADRIGIHGSQITYEMPDRLPLTRLQNLPDHQAAVGTALELLVGSALSSLEELSAVGHRMGHGGEYFDRSVLIDDDVMAKIYDTMDLLPLHGAAFVHGIEAAERLLPGIRQVAVFDSAFHQTMRKEAFLYALPLEQYEKYRIRRYGFHGTSHSYVTRKAAEILGFQGKFISCHLGNGGSVTAVENGRSVDTSMGFTPMTGLMMGTRCGDLDPYIPLHIMKTQHKTVDEVNALLNKESGWYGLSRGLRDVRDIEREYALGNPDAITAVDTYIHNLIKYIGAYAAVLNGVDALIFTAGIGQNSALVRRRVCQRLGYLGLEYDEKSNTSLSGTFTISKPESKVKVLVIPTDEELVIAEDTYRLISAAETESAAA